MIVPLLQGSELTILLMETHDVASVYLDLNHVVIKFLDLFIKVLYAVNLPGKEVELLVVRLWLHSLEEFYDGVDLLAKVLVLMVELL